MHRLIYYELDKIWRKRSFLLCISALMILNLLLLWYVNIPDSEQPPLSAYQSFQNTIAEMSETEKNDYISNLKETMDGVSFVREILNMQNMQNEKGNTLAKQAMCGKQDVFEKYYGIYRDGGYLNFTNSFWKEKEFVDDVYAEWQKAAEYDKYLQSVQENKDNLNNISIFAKQDENKFASRNVEKSSGDYLRLSGSNVRWMPSKAFSVSMENLWTDPFLVLTVFLFVGNMIFEEKGKKLFYIIRSTKKGQLQSILAKLTALLFHCVTVTLLLYGINLLFAGKAIGFGDLTANIQSVSTYMESNLSVNILEYILYSVFTKSIVLFSMGTVLTALCIFADSILLPCAVGSLLYGCSYILYLLIPAAERSSLLKYINFVGFMKTEELYGNYRNLNIMEYPISRLSFSWGIIITIAAIGIMTSISLFVHGSNFELIKRQARRQKHFRPHASLLRYESYKIMITNRAVLIILIFGFLTGGRIIKQEHTPSAQEQYYQDIMLQLEGELTPKKEKLISSEQKRYDKAFSEIEQIDNLVAKGEVSGNAGEGLKAQWYAVTFFYPSFERVLQQYERICESGGSFIYDTGYLYLFGREDSDYQIDLLLLSLCVVMAFSNVIAMEYQNGAWYLFSTTKQGKKKIIRKKTEVCMVTIVGLAFIPTICRMINISANYPLHGLDFVITDIPCYQHLQLPVPIYIFIILLILSQMASLAIAALIVLALSYWRKNSMQAFFFSVLLLIVPLILKLLGFSFAGWFSVYPLYSWTANIL